MTRHLVPSMRKTVGNILDHVGSGFPAIFPQPPERTGLSTEWWDNWPDVFQSDSPRIEIDENENEVHLCAELPGMNKDDFKVEVLGSRLVLSGERKSEVERKKKGYYYSERIYGSFSRSIELPEKVDVAKAQATYKNGELRIALPKTEAAKSRKIQVTVE